MKRLVSTVILAAAFASTVGLAKAQDIKIAVVGPITGSNAVHGEQLSEAPRWRSKTSMPRAACSAKSST